MSAYKRLTPRRKSTERLVALAAFAGLTAITVAGNLPASAATNAVTSAGGYLRAHASELGLRDGVQDLIAQPALPTQGGSVVTYNQVAGEYPVVDSQVKVTLDRSGNVLLVVSSYKQVQLQAQVQAPANVGHFVSAEQAASAAQAHLLVSGVQSRANSTRREVLAEPGSPARQVWRVVLEGANNNGAWETLVDASTGRVVSSRNLMQYDTGTGRVFNPNPVVTSQDTSLRDNDDRDSPQLTAQLRQVTLLGLDSRGYLDGQFASTSPSQGTRAFSTQHTYNYIRSDARFEEVMAYYHVDTTQRYIQSLGFTNVNNRPQPVKADAFSYDNSYYNPSNGRITLGRGGVDDGEDADVIIHEYGHAIQDNQVPGFGSSEEAGSMGEGFGDYWAMTNFASSQPRAWQPIIAEWDATSYDNHVPAYLRRLDLDLHYPQDLSGEVHHDGQIWSRALWDIWNRLGKRTSDTLVLQSHFSLVPSASFRDGAMAIVAADRALYAGRDVNAIQRIFADRGIPTR